MSARGIYVQHDTLWQFESDRNIRLYIYNEHKNHVFSLLRNTCCKSGFIRSISNQAHLADSLTTVDHVLIMIPSFVIKVLIIITLPCDQSVDHDPFSWFQSVDHDPLSCGQSVDHNPLSCGQSVDHNPFSWCQSVYHDPLSWCHTKWTDWVSFRHSSCNASTQRGWEEIVVVIPTR